MRVQQWGNREQR